MNTPPDKYLGLNLGRKGLDNRGQNPREPVMSDALYSKDIAISEGRGLQSKTAGMKTVSWLASQKTLYAIDTLDIGINAGSDNWTSRTYWRFWQDPTVIHNSSQVGFPYTPIHIEVGKSLYGGFDWGSTLLFDAGYGPLKATFPGGGVAHYSQQTTTLLELLNQAGDPIKSVSVVTTYAQDSSPTDLDESKVHSEFTFDTNGPTKDFWGIRVSLTLRDSPTWIDALNNGYFFFLHWITGAVE